MRACLHMYICIICEPGAYVSQKWASDPLEVDGYVQQHESFVRASVLLNVGCLSRPEAKLSVFEIF